MNSKLVFKLLLLSAFWMAPWAPAAGQPSDMEPQHFDLVLFGRNLTEGDLQVALKVTPGTRDEWTDIKSTSKKGRHTGRGYTTLVLTDLPVRKYIGQDIRENYLALKIVTEKGALHAVYAVPSAGRPASEVARHLHPLIIGKPLRVQQYSYAWHIRPRPFVFTGSQPFIEHIEAPVRHLPAGVQEAKWLNMLIGN